MSDNKILKIGHRGAKGYIAENTIASFEKAIALGVDAVELDVQLCRSGELVVFHDHRVDRLTNGEGRIDQLQYSYISKLKTGGSANIPTLNHVLDIIDNRIIVNIELKAQNTAIEVASVLNEYIDIYNWNKDKFIISSFDHIELSKFKKLCPDIKIAALTSAIPVDYALFAQNLGAYSVNVSLEFVNKKFVDDAHNRGLKIFVYTVNHTDDIIRMRKLGVDGIFSDFPDII